MTPRVFVSLLISFFLPLTSAGLFERSSASQTGAPENVRACYSGRYVQLNWDPADRRQTAGYNIYRATPEGWQWVKLNDSPHPLSSFIDISLPVSSAVYYRIMPVSDDGNELNTRSEIEVGLSAEVRNRAKQQNTFLTATFDKDFVLSDAEFTDSASMTFDEIQTFLTSRGSVLARYESNGMTAAQHIYNAAQTHGINPRLIVVMLQVQQGLITNSQLDLAKINSATNWNLSAPSAQNFADQIFYGTQQLREHYDNPNAYGLAINQPTEVNDGIVTPANGATAALYSYLPWIGEGGGGQKGIGGVHLFWDLLTNDQLFNGTESASVTLSKDSSAKIDEIDPTKPTVQHSLVIASATPASLSSLIVSVDPLASSWVNTTFLCDGRFGTFCAGGNRYLPGLIHTGLDLVNRFDGRVEENKVRSTLPSVVKVLKSDVFCQDRNCNDPNCPDFGNYVVLEHLLDEGRRIYSLYGHLLHIPGNQQAAGLIVNQRVTGGQFIGYKGTTGCSTGTHLHFEISNTTSAAPPRECESHWIPPCQGGVRVNVATGSTRVEDPAPFRNRQKRVLLPYFSYTDASPSLANYEVYGIANRPLYASITLTPTAQKVFTNIGVGGRVYGDESNIQDIFIRSTETFSSNQTRTLTGSRTFTAPGDYKFFAYIEGDQTGGIGSGYPLKVAILPNPNSKIVDNDSRNGYSANETGAQDVAGYFVSGKLFSGGSTNWAQWNPNISGNDEVWVHVPNGATATNVVYRIYADGQNPITTNPIDHSTNNDRWVRLTAGSTQTWNFNTNGYVYLVVSNVAPNQFVGVDAVKFIAASTACSSISINSTVLGELTTNDRPSVHRSGRFADYYCFSGTAGQRIAIMMGSYTLTSDGRRDFFNPEFDTYLYLLDSSGMIITSDDDGWWGDGASRIPRGSGAFSLPYTGNYIIEATSYSSGATGRYRVYLVPVGQGRANIQLSFSPNPVRFDPNARCNDCTGSWQYTETLSLGGGIGVAFRRLHADFYGANGQFTNSQDFDVRFYLRPNETFSFSSCTYVVGCGSPSLTAQVDTFFGTDDNGNEVSARATLTLTVSSSSQFSQGLNTHKPEKVMVLRSLPIVEP